MLNRLDRIGAESLGELARDTHIAGDDVGCMLEQLRDQRIGLRSGISRRNDPRTATIEQINEDSVELATQNFDFPRLRQFYLNFSVGGSSYFFAAEPIDSTEGHARIALPAQIYQAERRELGREGEFNGSPGVFVRLLSSSGPAVDATVVDQSLHGLGVRVRAEVAQRIPENLRVQFLRKITGAPEFAFASVRHRTEVDAHGWAKIGLSVSLVEPTRRIEVDRRDQLLDRPILESAKSVGAFVRAAAHSTGGRFARRLGLAETSVAEVPIVDYCNEKGQAIRAIRDGWGAEKGATAVVIPPAWGRTKETLLPLAATIVETFRRAGEPVIVLRFDGTNRRGESYIDPECRAPGSEYLKFTFSQAARDIRSTVRYLHEDPSRRPAKTIVLTFSLASVEGRRAVAEDGGREIDGWVSVVGMADLQSALRTISGGIDYGFGLLKGVRFGRHELVGVVADMDHTGLDAIENQIGFLEEVRRDMQSIDVPITWIHGRHDAWMDIDRVAEVMSCGDIARRKLIEVPTGHQLRTSRQALATFQLVAQELSEIALGAALPGMLPNLHWLASRTAAERSRLPKSKVDLRVFWGDYLLGRDRRAGMELLTATAAYRNHMERQVRMLQPEPGARLLDAGSGTGEFARHLKQRHAGPESAHVLEMDFVSDALGRSRQRFEVLGERNSILVERCVTDLNASDPFQLPVRDASLDGALASLVLGYLESPESFLDEMFRVLRPGGRLVVSNLVRDADVSKLLADGLAEFQSPSARSSLGRDAAEHFDALVTSFLNDASRILDLEEEGRFQFWDEDELRYLVSNAGFHGVVSEPSLGDPPQAVIVVARRP